MNHDIYKSKKRNLLLLLNTMINLIPENSDNDQFIDDLKRVRDRCAYTDPDVMYNMWVEAQSIISNKFAYIEILPEWSIEFIKLWTNKKDNIEL
jgi:hypothetical protein